MPTRASNGRMATNDPNRTTPQAPASHPDRTLLVLVAVTGWASAGLLAGVLLMDGARRGGTAAVPPNPIQAAARNGDQHPETPISLAGVKTGDQFMKQLAIAFGKPVHPHWEHMLLRADQSVRFDLPSADVATAFRLLNSQVNNPFGDVLDYRLFPDHVEVATLRYFDQSEMTAVNYDLTSLVRAIRAAAPASAGGPPSEGQIVQTVIRTIEDNVAMEAWMDNGGDLGRISVVGSGMLVTAPQRFHPQIAWVLEQIEQTPGWTTGFQRLLGPVTGGPLGGGGGPVSSAPAANGAGGTAADPVSGPDPDLDVSPAP